MYPGSFDPITYWHLDIIKRSKQSFWNLIVWIWEDSTKTYMFTFPERVAMVNWAVKSWVDESLETVNVIPFSWLLVNFCKREWVTNVVRWIRDSTDFAYEQRLQTVWNTQWENIETNLFIAWTENNHVSSSMAKGLLKEQWDIQDFVTLNVKDALESRLLGQHIVWLTWTIWAWKSYIADKFVALWEEHWIETHNIDLDKIWHYILCESNMQWHINLRKQLQKEFWESILDEKWFVDRKVLWPIVFSNKTKREKLDSLIKDLLMVEVSENMKWKKWILLVNGALIAEAWISWISNNNIVLVWVSKEVQRDRLWNSRNHNEEELERRINSQFSTEKKSEIINSQINEKKYWNLESIENNWNNDEEIKILFNKVLSNVDLYWELRIKSVLKTLQLEDKFEKLYWDLKKKHDTVERMYHSWSHIVDCLNKLYKIKHTITDDEFNKLFFAFLFHDVIYNAQNKPWINEKESAEYAKYVLNTLWLDENFSNEVYELIMLTAGHKSDSKDQTKEIMCDIDLSILGSDRQQYREYMKAIRYEYICYPDREYNIWRSNLLKKFLESPIFQSDYFKEKYEEQAKQNLIYEIAYLSKK